MLSILKKYNFIILIICIPFLLFYWMLPFLSHLTFGTDYINYHIYHHLDLMFSIKSGSFPLFAPECYYGQSAAAYTQAQVYHPLSYIASALPGYWDGLSLEWMTLLRLITLAICHLFVFQFFTRLHPSRLLALVLSTIAIYNLRMLVLFWHGPAFEGYTGFLLLCVATGNYLVSPTRYKGPLLIIFSTYWLLTSGYPPIVYYGLIGAALFALIIPYFAATVLQQPLPRWKMTTKLWLKSSGFLLIGILLSAAYLFPFIFDFMAKNVGRTTQSYLWTVELNDTLPGFINNFFYPLQSALGLFGGSPLFLVAALVPTLKCFRYKIPGSIWAVTVIIIFTFFYMQGDRTPVHFWIWKYLPLAKSIRNPGYAAIILPLFFALLLTWLIKAPPLFFKISGKQYKLSAIIIPTAAALITTVVYVLLPDNLFANPHFACPVNIRSIPEWIKPATIITGTLILTSLLLTYRPKKIFRPGAIILLALTLLQITILLRWAPFSIEKKVNTPTYQEIQAEKKRSINFQQAFYLNGMTGSKTVVRQLKNYFMEPMLGTIYRDILPATNQDDAYDILNTTRQQHQAVIENYRPEDLPVITTPPCESIDDRVALAYSSYNRLVFKARACQPSFFVCSYPYSGHWRAWVNNKKATIYRANGAAQAVLIPQGSSTVEFRYWSWAAFWGMLVSCLTLALAGSIFCLRGLKRPSRYFIAAIPTITAVGLFLFWYNSLYSGQNLHTNYHWQSSQRTTGNNLAFGKSTKMSSHRRDYPYRYNSRHAIDGDTTAASCFITNIELNPWWMVDLKHVQSVKKIIIWTHSLKDMPTNYMPFIISISENGKSWMHTAIDQPSDSPAIHVNFEKRERARYVRIQASQKCALTLNEVMVLK